jgi:ribosomal protein S18 acetylase RimI-like enzyme
MLTTERSSEAKLDSLRGVSLRRIRESDDEFLLRVYAESREDEMALLPWTQSQKDAFIHMQFQAQASHYRAYSPPADFLIIEREGTSIGRLYLHRTEDEVTIVDIALVADLRGSGIGTALIGQILHDAGAASKQVRIHVERFNRALSLYTRLGFTKIADEGVYYEMEWRPPVTVS